MYLHTIAASIVLIFFLTLAIVGNAVISRNTSSSSPSLSRLPILSGINKLLGAKEKDIKGTKEGRTNILLLGVGGEGHDGPELADTIMVASIERTTRELALISIPRDLLVPTEKYGVQKINFINALGERNKRKKGPELTARTIENVFGIPIHYYIRIDFSAFETIIDALGGIDIYVSQGFSDPYYPLGPNQFQTVSFSKGWHNFDGATALKYARSRYTTSDFDRAQRQQEILKATKEKVLSLKTWTNPGTVSALWKAVNDHVETNLSIREIQALLGMVPTLQTDNVKQLVFSDAPENFLYATTTQEGAFVLLPRQNDYAPLARAMQNIFTNDSFTSPYPLPEPQPQQEEKDTTESSSLSEKTNERPVRLIIHNGTRTPRLAARTAALLSKHEFTVVEIGNAQEQNHTTTVIFDLTEGAYPEERSFLQGFLDAEIKEDIPENISSSYAGAADFYIVLGSTLSL